MLRLRLAAIALPAIVLTACTGTAGDVGDSPASDHTAARAAPSPSPRLGSIKEAVAYLEAKVEVPILLPSGLPSGIRLDSRHPVSVLRFNGGGTQASLHLDFEEHGHLQIQYGVAVFDGCGAESARRVRVLGHPALINAFPRHHLSEVIWPATPKHPQGRYGLSGTFGDPEILRLAASMRPAESVLRTMERDVGC